MTRIILMLCAVIAMLSLKAAEPEMRIESGVEVRWQTSTGNTYRVQWSSSADDWNDLGSPITGNGLTNVVYHSAPGGTPHYRIVEVSPGTPTNASILLNGSFESGEGASATNWSATASQPPVRSSAVAHSGTWAMRCLVTNATAAANEAMLSQRVGTQGGSVEAGRTYDFSFWARQVSSGASYVQQYQVQWLDTAGAIIGGTGLVNFNGVNGVWTRLSVPNLTAPTNTRDARVRFRFVTGAVAGGHGEVFIDDVALLSQGGTASPGQTNILQVVPEVVAKVDWVGADYYPSSTTNLSSAEWNLTLPPTQALGSNRTLTIPMVHPAQFIRLQKPPVVVEPPTNLRRGLSGVTNAISLAWTASATANVFGYRILFGTAPDERTNRIDLGNVTAATIGGLVIGQTYYFAVVAMSAEGESNPELATISARLAEASDIVPLFDAGTSLEPETTIDTTTALITHIADRARDRHAREDMFRAYDHYLSWYWEERTIAIEIVDRVAKGGTGITFNYTTLTPLEAPEFRAFFRGINTVAEYHFNYLAPLVGSNRYSATVSTKLPENRPLRMGDRVEIEISQFLRAPAHGRNNYYGTALLYIVGQGIVPWQGVGPLLDSYPLPDAAWLGGQTTLPYQYSNEPEDRFKQMAGNVAPTNAQPFMLGRRLHHTDFGNGAHSESGNPAFTAQIGKLGPKFIARSCVACHVNNGRALPPAIGASLLQAVVKVGNDSAGSPHPNFGAVLQPQGTNGSPEGSVSIASYTQTEGQYADGSPYSLRKPNYTFSGTIPSYFSVRLAPPLVGLGLLEAVSETSILGLADPGDTDGDGVSGRIQTVRDPETGETRLGRFNAKGGQARVKHQVAAALNTDMGVTTTIFPIPDGESSPQAAEVDAVELELMTRYVALLGVSARRAMNDPQASRGEQLFSGAGCAKCHTPNLTTSAYYPMTELRNQTIHPYTDLLLHDMGPGLADNMGELNASGLEWRTPPLWSIGLTAGVSGGEAYLHDGRARTLEEAILWHGGEGEAAKEAFRTMPAVDREAVISFLKSL